MPIFIERGTTLVARIFKGKVKYYPTWKDEDIELVPDEYKDLFKGAPSAPSRVRKRGKKRDTKDPGAGPTDEA